MLTAGRARNLMLFYIGFHLLVAPSVNAVSDIQPIRMCIFFNHLICTETLVAFLAVHQRIAESSQMPAGYPCLRIHQYCTVHTYIIRGFLNELLPPCLLYIVLQFYAKISIVPCIRKAAVNLRPRIYESS